MLFFLQTKLFILSCNSNFVIRLPWPSRPCQVPRRQHSPAHLRPADSKGQQHRPPARARRGAAKTPQEQTRRTPRRPTWRERATQPLTSHRRRGRRPGHVRPRRAPTSRGWWRGPREPRTLPPMGFFWSRNDGTDWVRAPVVVSTFGNGGGADLALEMLVQAGSLCGYARCLQLPLQSNKA